jgi:chorismate synthase
MIDAIDQAKNMGDTLGGIFEVVVTGIPAGLGSYVHWDRKLDGRLACALMSIQGIKGVEIGLGFESASLPGSQVHDEIRYTEAKGFYRITNRAGGIEGGMTNGEPIVLHGAMKPIPTLLKPLNTVDMVNKSPVQAQVERSDICAVPAACVVGEAVTAWVIAQTILEKFGADTMTELKGRVEEYRKYVKQV